MLVALGAEFLHRFLRHRWQIEIGKLKLKASCQKTAGIQQVVDQLIESISLLFDDSQAVSQGLLVPISITTR